MMMMSWCLMSSDVIWHIRDKLWPMPKHGSIKATYVRCMRVLAVTCHLHFWQNDRDFLRATAVTRGWNGYRNKSQHRKSTLEKKILPPFQQGFEPATFQSRVRCSNHWAIPAPCPSWMSLIADACMRSIRTSETRWSRDHFDYTFEMLACTWFERLTKHFRQKETRLARDHPHRKLHIADAGLHLVRAAEWNSKQNKHF